MDDRSDRSPPPTAPAHPPADQAPQGPGRRRNRQTTVVVVPAGVIEIMQKLRSAEEWAKEERDRRQRLMDRPVRRKSDLGIHVAVIEALDEVIARLEGTAR